MLTGITLNSTVKGGGGPVMQVGNTVMGVVDDVAKEAVTAPPTPPIVVEAQRIASTAVKPVYTKLARNEGIEGEITLHVYIDETGRVTKTVVIVGLGFMLDESAQAAAMIWRYRPKTVDGVAVKARMTERLNFVLDDF